MNKRGQEMLKIIYGIKSITKEYCKGMIYKNNKNINGNIKIITNLILSLFTTF